jgi:hypothetical protein
MSQGETRPTSHAAGRRHVSLPNAAVGNAKPQTPHSHHQSSAPTLPAASVSVQEADSLAGAFWFSGNSEILNYATAASSVGK